SARTNLGAAPYGSQGADFDFSFFCPNLLIRPAVPLWYNILVVNCAPARSGRFCFVPPASCRFFLFPSGKSQNSTLRRIYVFSPCKGPRVLVLFTFSDVAPNGVFQDLPAS